MIAGLLTPKTISSSSVFGRDFKLDFRLKTYVMGIVNVTPDSFSDGGKYYDVDSAVAHCVRLEREGADIIDIGGESSRPTAAPVSVSEELQRVLPVIKQACRVVNIPISIDTCKHQVAVEAIRSGASIVNDITALRDPAMARVVAEHDVPVILMHMQGTPLTMQTDPRYGDVVSEILDYLKGAIARAVKAGISVEKIIIDPGIGFGKTVRHNIEILRGLKELTCIGRPIAIGASRKSFIAKILNCPSQDTIVGSLSVAAIAIYNGANIVRVHDVVQTKEVAKILDAMMHKKEAVS